MNKINLIYSFISIVQLSSDGVTGGSYLTALKFPNENPSQFQFKPLSNEEVLEVIDEDNVQSFNNDIAPAEPVSDSLVEVVEENSANQAQTESSSLSSAFFTIPRHKVQALQTGYNKPLAKLKQKSVRVHPFSSKSKIFTRVSIPGKHRLFDTYYDGTSWRKLLLSRKYKSLNYNAFRKSALQLSNNTNVTDEARKRINEMERNQASSRDILDAFIFRMGLNVTSDLHRKPSLHIGVPERPSRPYSSKNVLLDNGNTHLQSPTVIKGVPLEKRKQKTSPLKVFDNLSYIKFLKNRKNSTSKGKHKYENNSTNLKILNSSLSDRDSHFLDHDGTGRDKLGLGTRPKIHESQLSASVNNTQTKAKTPQLKEYKSQVNNSGNIVTGRDKSGLGTRPKIHESQLSASVNNTQTKAKTPQLKEYKSQDHNNSGNIVAGRDKYGLGTRPKSQGSPLSPSVNNTQTKTTTTREKNSKSQDRSRNIVTGREKFGLETRHRSQVSPLTTSVNSSKKNTTTSQLKNKKSQDKSRNIAVNGHDKSGHGTRHKIQVSPLGPSVNNKETKATPPNLKNENSEDKSGNIRDYPKMEPNNKNVLNHSKSGGHNLTLVHSREKNATYLNSTKLSIKTNRTLTLSVDSKTTLKHFSDLINFFNSLNSSSGAKLTTNSGIGGNRHVSNKFKNNTRNHTISENLLRFLDFVHIKKTGENYTSKSLGLEKGHTHSNHDSIADQIRKQLQMSIYRGWNRASKGRRFGYKKLPTSSNASVKTILTHSNDTRRLESNDSLKDSKGDTFELNVLQMIKNVSQKELLKLEGDIVNALRSARLWNLPKQHDKQNLGQQHRISSEKMTSKHRQIINRQHDKQEDVSEKKLIYQQQFIQHHNLKVGQQQNQTHTKKKYNQTNQQIEDTRNGTTLHQHKFAPEQQHPQQTYHPKQHLKKNNMSHSMESTIAVQNCNSSVSVNTTKKYLNYGCDQTHNKLSLHNKGSKDLFSHSFNTSHIKTGELIKSAHTLHNAAPVQPPLARHSSTIKITRNNTWPSRIGDGTTVTKPVFNVVKDVDDTRNVSVQLDRDSGQEPVNAESISEGTTGSGVVELTEYVDQGKLRLGGIYIASF